MRSIKDASAESLLQPYHIGQSKSDIPSQHTQRPTLFVTGACHTSRTNPISQISVPTWKVPETFYAFQASPTMTNIGDTARYNSW